MYHGDKVKVIRTGKIGLIERIRPAMQVGNILLPEKYVVRFGQGKFSAWVSADELARQELREEKT